MQNFGQDMPRECEVVAAVILGWSAGPDPESRDSGFDAAHRPGMTTSRALGVPLSFPFNAVSIRNNY
jgi:hypothetical protein